MPELRVLMWFFAIFFHRVAWGGARWDPVALLAKEPIGITRYGKVHGRPKFGSRPALFRAIGTTALSFARRVERATARAARNGRPSKAKKAVFGDVSVCLSVCLSIIDDKDNGCRDNG